MVTECDTVIGSDGNDQFVVDVAAKCHVILHGGAGSDVYTFHPCQALVVTIADYNSQVDRVDLRQFPHIKSLKDVNMTRGSVVIHLPQFQTIIISNYVPSDMKDSHFIFAKSSKSEGIFVGFAMILFFVVMGISALCVGNHVVSTVDWDFVSNMFEQKNKIYDSKNDDEGIDALPSQRSKRRSMKTSAAREPELEAIPEGAAPPLATIQQSSSYYNISSLDSSSSNGEIMKSYSDESSVDHSDDFDIDAISDLPSSGDDSVEMELQEKMLEVASRLPYKLPLAYMSKEPRQKTGMFQSGSAARVSPVAFRLQDSTVDSNPSGVLEDPSPSADSASADDSATDGSEEREEYLNYMRTLASEFSMQFSFFEKLESESDDEKSSS